MNPTSTTSAPRTRWRSVLLVLVAAPWFAELAWGGYPVTDLPLILLFLAPVYGCAALLVREVARRTGRGWPTMLLLGAAFGVLQAGVVDQSLFNPSYGRFDFQHPAHLPGIDVSLYYLVAFVTGHVVASIAAPIAVAEVWSRGAGRSGTEPWLGRRAVWVVPVVFVLASVVNHLGVKYEEGGGFQARPDQTLAALAVVAALVAAALLLRRRPLTDRRVPRPWVLAVLGFAAYLLYLPGEGTAAAVAAVGVVLTAVVVLGAWSRSARWNDDHTVALALGTIAVGLVQPFWTEPYDNTMPAGREMVVDVAAATICLTIVVATYIRSLSPLGSSKS